MTPRTKTIVASLASGGRPPVGGRVPRIAGLLAAIVSAGVLLAGSARAQQASPAEKDTANTESGERPYGLQILRQFAVRSRPLERELTRAEREVEAGRYREAVQSLQAILDQKEDGFVVDEKAGRLVSLRSQAVRLIAGLPAEGLRVYEQYSGTTAEQLLRDAETSRKWWLYGEVVRRFPLTAAGFSARLALADRWLDRGDARTAAGFWRELLQEPIHRRRFDEATLQKMLLTAAAAGDSELAGLVRTELARRFPGNVPVEAGLDRVPPVQVGSPRAGTTRRGFDREWGMFLGDASHTRSSHATAPFTEPAWSSSFAHAAGTQRARDQRSGQFLSAVLPDELVTEIAEWDRQQAGKGQPRSVANMAIAVGQQVIVRDFDGIRSLDLATGDVLWSFAGTATYREPSPGASAQSAPGRITVASLFAEGSVLGTLSSDGQRVFAVDALDLALPRRTRRGAAAAEKNAEERSSNVLVALDLNPAGEPRADGPRERRPAWRVGGLPGENGAASLPLAGHYFLGAPLPSDGRLFAVSELDGQLNLTMLDAATGSVVWSQGLGYVERPVELDSQRSTQACLPALAEETIVCPTEAAALVGLSAATGSLGWVYYCGDDPTDGSDATYYRRNRPVHGHEGFPAAPLISRGNVVYLPQHSRDVHCVDLATGAPRWTAARGDGQFLGAVTDDGVLVVGTRSCRLLSLADGRERWSVKIAAPSGTGLLAGATYLVPVEDGRVISLDLVTGRETGLTVPRFEPSWDDETPQEQESPASHPPGNLIPAGDFIVATGAFGVVAYRQSGRMLEETLAALRKNPNDVSLRLQRAELTVQGGDTKSAAPELRRLLREARTDEQRARARRLLRELLYLELSLATTRDAADPILRELDQLDGASSEPEERGRFLVRRVEWQLKSGDVDGVMQSVRELSAIDAAQPIPFGGNRQHLVSATAWAPAILERLRDQVGAEGLRRVTREVEREAAAARAARDDAASEQFLAVYGRWPEADEVRIALAARRMREGEFQRAEMLLREAARSTDFDTRAAAIGALVAAWSRLGLDHEAAALVAEFERSSSGANASLAEPAERKALAQQWRDALPEHSLTRDALRQLAAVPFPVKRVRITEDRWAAGEAQIEDLGASLLRDAFVGYRRKYQLPADSSFHLLDFGAGENSKPGESRANVVDRHTGVVTGSISLPVRNSYPSYLTQVRWNHSGHFFTMGAEGEALGISLIDIDGERPLWRTKLPRTGRDVVRAGPAGPTFCTFQSRKLLYVLDPATGRVLWERGDLEPNSGLASDPNTGLFGDSECLVVFDGDALDRGKYTVYRTATGEELSTGRLDIDGSMPRRVIGRRLLYTRSREGDRGLRLWDPLTDQTVRYDAVDERPQSALVDDAELAVLEANGRLVVRDLETQEVRLDVPLRPDDLMNLTSFRVFRDPDTYFVNLQREMRTPFLQTYNSALDNAFLPAVTVSGDLYAFDRKTGRLRWKQHFPLRSVINLPDHRLPFLVMITRIRERTSGTQSLQVEAIDKATGATLGAKNNIVPDRTAVFSYDADRSRIDLIGPNTVVRLEFGKDVQRLPKHLLE